MAYSIRPFKDADAPALAKITAEAIKHIGSRHYSDAQVAAWSARHPGPERFLERSVAGEYIFVAVDESDFAVGYALLAVDPDDGGHLDMLYCHPDHTRQGLAERSLRAAEQTGRRLQLSRLYTEASELARSSFERAGYKVTHRRDFTIEHDGKDVPIHNYAMEKHLI